MMRRISIGILIAVILACLALLGAYMLTPEFPAEPTPRAAPRWTMTAPRAVPKHDVYEYVPEVRAADGALILAHNSGPSHHSPTGREAIIRRSTNHGATWTTTLKLWGRTGQLWSNEALTRLPSGTLLALMSRSTTHDQIDIVRLYKSTNNGKSWTRHGPDYRWRQAATFGNLTVLADGSLLVPWHGDGWGMAAFDRGGMNGRIASVNNGGRWMMEGRILRVSGCNLLGTGRLNGSGIGPGLHLFKSTDCGKTWGQGQPTGLKDLSEGFTVTGDRLTMVTIHRPTGRMELRQASVRQLWVDPTAWSAPLYLTTLRGSVLWDRGYPHLVTLASGDLFLTYYAGDRRPSVFTTTLTRA